MRVLYGFAVGLVVAIVLELVASYCTSNTVVAYKVIYICLLLAAFYDFIRRAEFRTERIIRELPLGIDYERFFFVYTVTERIILFLSIVAVGLYLYIMPMSLPSDGLIMVFVGTGIYSVYLMCDSIFIRFVIFIRHGCWNRLDVLVRGFLNRRIVVRIDQIVAAAKLANVNIKRTDSRNYVNHIITALMLSMGPLACPCRNSSLGT
jgi:hypothetical protein